MLAIASRRLMERSLMATVVAVSAATAGQRVIADEPPAKEIRVIVQAQDDAETSEAAPKYWLGIMLKKVEGDLAAYLGAGQGVFVDSVFPDSPAAAAGLKKGDVLLKAGGQELTETSALLKAIEDIEVKDGQPTPLKLSVLRQGDQLELELVPAPRPDEAKLETKITVDASVETQADDAKPQSTKSFSFSFSGDAPHQELHEMLKKLGHAQMGQELEVLRLGNPSVLFIPENAALEGEMEIVVKKQVDGDDIEVTIKRENKEPAKITVKKDETVQEYTEDQLQEMPKAVRVIVEPMLTNKGQRTVNWHVIEKKLSESALDPAQAKELAEKYGKVAEELANKARLSAEELRAQVSRANLDQARAAAQEARTRLEARVKGRLASEESAQMVELKKLVEELRSEVKDLRQQLEKSE